MTEPTKTLNAAELERLAKERAVRDSAAATERGTWAAAFKKSQELYGLDSAAWNFWYSLKKKDSARASRIVRNFLHYNELSPVDVQGDLEDFLKGSSDEAEADSAEDMDAEAQAETKAASSGALKRFAQALLEAADEASVNRGLERFVADFPASADEAAHLAQARIRAIAAEQGGGEDVRPDHLRNAHVHAATQTASEAKVFTRRFNAERSAKRHLGDNFQIVQVDGGFTYSPRPN